MKFKSSIILFILCLVFLQSCSTLKQEGIIPGEKQARIKNIYIEYMNIADEYFKLENYSKAAVYYTYALDNKDLYWTAYYKLAKSYAYQEKWSDALSLYKNLLNRDPENTSLISSLAYIYAMTSQFKEAKDLYLSLIENNPNVSSFLENYISILVTEGSIEEGYKEFEILKEKFPESSKISNFEKEFEVLLKTNDQGEAKEEPEPKKESN